LRRPLQDFAALRGELAEPSAVQIWDLLAQAKSDPIYRQIAILAWGGYGKTTLMRHIAYTLGKNQQPQGVPRLIPVLLLLRKHRALLTTETAPDLAQLITAHHIPSLPVTAGLRVPTDWAKSHLQRGRMVVMFDGFDEVPQAQRPRLARWLQTQMQAYRNSVFILTSRPKAYTEQPVADRLDFHTLLWVRDFNPKQRQAFVQQWYWCQEYYYHGKQDIPAVKRAAEDAAQDLLHQIGQRAELTDLAKNPLLLNMIAMFHRHDPSAQLPKRRVELYQQICQLLLKDRPGARQLETLMDDWEAAQIIVQMLALTMMQQKVERLEQAELLTCLTEYLQAQEETVTAREFLQVIEQISELLVQREPGEYEFAHLSFQEFLAAKEIVRRQQVEVLYDHVAEDWWKAVILLYAAQVKPSGLIRGLLQRGATDLAYACWQETSKRIDADLQKDLQEVQALRLAAAAVQTSRYAALESSLKAQQWIEADQETYRLMITAVGKEEGQWFAKEELLNFPCEELRAIDGLWVQYSQGHFGFSAQKQIYVECGATLDGNYPGDRIWEAFGDRVGWRENGDWLLYSDISKNLSLSSPEGVFPCFWWGLMVVGGFWVVFLLSHKDL
jgi:predicted NACHT family NTPase